MDRAEALLRVGIEQCEQQLGLPEHVYTGRLVLARTLLAAGQRQIIVEGPAELPEAAAVHAGFWDPERAEHRG